MPERIVIDQVVQLFPESTPGTTGAATKQMQTFQCLPEAHPEAIPFTPAGYKYPTVAVYNREWSIMKVTGTPSFGEIVYFLSCVLGKATITASGASTYAKNWAFGPSSNAADTPQTFTLEHGDTTRGEQIAYAIATGFTMHVTRQKIDFAVDMIGQRLTDGFTMTVITPVSAVQSCVLTGVGSGTFTINLFGITSGTLQWNSTPAQTNTVFNAAFGTGNIVASGGTFPAAQTWTYGGNYANQPIPIPGVASSLVGGSATATITTTTPGVPLTPEPTAQVLQPNQIDCWIDTTSANLGGTQMLRAFDIQYAVTNRFGPIWPLQSSLNSFAATVEIMPKVDVKMTLACDAAGMAYLTSIRNGTTQFLRVKASGPVLDSINSINYGVTLDQAIKITGVGAPKDLEGIYVREFTGTIVHDPGYGKAMSATVINKLAAL